MSKKNNQEVFEIGDEKQQIGTEIFDPTLPSDLDFDQGKSAQYEGKQINEGFGVKETKGKTKLVFDEEIKSYKIKGKILFNDQPKYRCASYVKEHVDTFEVKAYDQQKSGGLKSVWESIIGYVKREICIVDGYFYIFQKTKQGYFTHASFRLVDLFKIFVDSDESMMRLIFQAPDDLKQLRTINLKVKSCQDMIEKMMEESSKIGLMTISE